MDAPEIYDDIATAGRRPMRRRRRSGRLQRKQTRLAWIMLAPALVVVGLVALYPLGVTIFQSFTDKQFLAIEPTKWIGLENYRTLIHDTIFRDSIVTTVKFTVITVGFEFVLGMIIALVVNSNFKGRGVMRAVMLVPWAIPTVVAAQMWKWMYDDIFGVINDIGVRLHLIPHSAAWIAQPSTALASVCAVDIWKTTPFVALLLLAGLQVIPHDLYEAADVDGASKLTQFWRITLPLLQPAILVALIFRTLDALRVFDVFYVFFGNRVDTQTMAIYDQNTIVVDRQCRLRRGDQRRDLPDHRDLRRHLRDPHQGERGKTRDEHGRRSRTARSAAASRLRRCGRTAVGRLVAPDAVLPAVAAIARLLPVPLLLGRSAPRSRPRSKLFQTPIQYFPRIRPWRTTRGALSANFFTRRTAQLGDRRRLGHDPLARDRLARRLRARPLPLPRPLVRPLPGAVDDDLPADRDPRCPLHDDHRSSTSTTRSAR